MSLTVCARVLTLKCRGRYHGSQMVYPHEEPGRRLAEIQGVAHDLRARLADDVAGWLLVPGRVHEVADAKPKTVQ